MLDFSIYTRNEYCDSVVVLILLDLLIFSLFHFSLFVKQIFFCLFDGMPTFVVCTLYSLFTFVLVFCFQNALNLARVLLSNLNVCFCICFAFQLRLLLNFNLAVNILLTNHYRLHCSYDKLNQTNDSCHLIQFK